MKEALDVYKSIRQELKTGLPIWPLGLSDYSDEWVSFGLTCNKTIYLAVWRREGENHTINLPVPSLEGQEVKVSCVYPAYSEVPYHWEKQRSSLGVTIFGDYMARLFKITVE